jgi:hypothetical protein
MLDPLMLAFESEMKAKTTARPASRQHARAEETDTLSGSGAVQLARRCFGPSFGPPSVLRTL